MMVNLEKSKPQEVYISSSVTEVPCGQNKGPTTEVAVVLASDLSTEYASVRLLLVCQEQHVQSVRCHISFSHIGLPEQGTRLRGDLTSRQGRHNGTRLRFLNILVEVFPFIGDHFDQATGRWIGMPPLNFSIATSEKLRTGRFCILYDRISVHHPHRFQPFATDTDLFGGLGPVTIWTFHTHPALSKPKKVISDLPISAVRSIGSFFVDVKHSGWRKDLLHLGLVRKSWTSVHELFLTSLSEFQARHTDMPPVERLVQYIKRDPSRSKYLTKMDVSVLNASWDGDPVAECKTADNQFRSLCSLFDLTTSLTSVNISYCSRIPPQALSQAFKTATTSPGVQRFRFYGETPTPASIKMAELLDSASSWPALRDFQAINWFNPETSTSALDSPKAEPVCLFPLLEKFFLNAGRISSSYFRGFATPVLAIFLLRKVDGLRMSDLRYVLSQATKTLQKIAVMQCNFVDDTNGEYAIDCVVPLLQNIQYIRVSGQVASPLALTRRTQTTRSVSSVFSLDYSPQTSNIEPANLLDALRVTTWSEVRLLCRGSWTEDEIREAKIIKKQRYPEVKIEITTEDGSV